MEVKRKYYKKKFQKIFIPTDLQKKKSKQFFTPPLIKNGSPYKNNLDRIKRSAGFY